MIGRRIVQVEVPEPDLVAVAQAVARDADDRPVYGGTPSDNSVLEAISELKAAGQAVMFYPFILLAPGSIGLLVSDNYPLQLLGVLGLAFSIVMLIISRQSADFTRHTLFLKNENSLP